MNLQYIIGKARVSILFKRVRNQLTVLFEYGDSNLLNSNTITAIEARTLVNIRICTK